MGSRFRKNRKSGPLQPGPGIQLGKKLPKDKKIVLYCGGAKAHCPTVGKELEGMGYSPIYVIDEGFMAWKYKGFPTVPKELEGWTIPESIEMPGNNP